MSQTRLKGFRVTFFHKKVAIAVACPKCRSAVNWPCFSLFGKPSSTEHAARRNLYYAKLQEWARDGDE